MGMELFEIALTNPDRKEMVYTTYTRSVTLSKEDAINRSLLLRNSYKSRIPTESRLKRIKDTCILKNQNCSCGPVTIYNQVAYDKRN